MIKTAESAFEPWGNRLPIGVNNTYQNRWEMQGKSREMTFGMNRVDFGARTFNPITFVWDRIDPMADARVWVTPYNMAQNNPINRIDPDGALRRALLW